MVVDPVAAVVGLAAVVDRRDADRQRAPVVVQALRRARRRTPPSSGASPPTCRGRRRTRTARSRGRSRRSRRRRRTSRGRRRDGPLGRVGEDRRPSRRPWCRRGSTATSGTPVPRAVSRNCCGLRRSASFSSTTIVVDAGAPNQNGDTWSDRVGAGVELGEGVVERPVRRPRVDVERPRSDAAAGPSPPPRDGDDDHRHDDRRRARRRPRRSARRAGATASSPAARRTRARPAAASSARYAPRSAGVTDLRACSTT